MQSNLVSFAQFCSCSLIVLHLRVSAHRFSVSIHNFPDPWHWIKKFSLSNGFNESVILILFSSGLMTNTTGVVGGGGWIVKRQSVQEHSATPLNSINQGHKHGSTHAQKRKRKKEKKKRGKNSTQSCWPGGPSVRTVGQLDPLERHSLRHERAPSEWGVRGGNRSCPWGCCRPPRPHLPPSTWSCAERTLRET